MGRGELLRDQDGRRTAENPRTPTAPRLPGGGVAAGMRQRVYSVLSGSLAGVAAFPPSEGRAKGSAHN